jgi:PAS domain S-box-containing protein
VVDTAEADTQAPGLRRDAILEAVAFAAEQLLLSPDWRDAADGVLARLAISADVSRAYIMRNVVIDSRDCVEQLAEWCAPGISSQLANPSLIGGSWEDNGLGRWVNILRDGGLIQSRVEDLPLRERDELQSEEILSIAVFPVTVDSEWWGLIGFDDCIEARNWSQAELAALRAAATVLGAAIQRRRAEELALANESRYQAFVEQIPAVTYTDVLIDGRAHIDYISPQVELLLGYPRQAFRDDPDFWFSIIHSDDRGRVEEAASQEYTEFDTEYRMVAADGRVVWVHDMSAALVDEHGETVAWQGFLVDITARRLAEERLRAAEERYRVLVEHIPAVVYVERQDGDPDHFYISPQVERVFGYSAEEWRLTDGFWIDRVHPDDRPMVQADDVRSNQEMRTFSLDYRFKAADGTWRWVHEEAVALQEPDGSGYWQGFMLDITERKEVEEQLREAELKFRTIVEQSQAVFYTQEIDPHDPTLSNTTYIAPGNAELVGYTLEDIQRDPGLWRKIIHPEDRERVLAADAASNTGGGDNFSMEFRMIRKDGRIVWVQDEATLVRIPGKTPYWQGFLLDVTERKLAEEQLARALDAEREAAQRLRSVDEMKNTFLQAVSHDLRTPLAAILGLAITLERGDVHLAEDDARDLAGRIAENARKLERLVTNLLDMDRLARGIVTPKLVATDVGELVERVVAESNMIEPSRLTVDTHPVTIQAEAAKIERIVENLLANTARHTPSNAHVWVTVREFEGGALLIVEDSGVGVPPELRETIFEPFRQGPEAPQHSPGVGVGLTLVRSFAELHGGRAWIEEREGGGASFRVFLPAGGPEAAGIA